MSDNLNRFIQDWLPSNNELYRFYSGIDAFLEEFLPVNDQEDTDSIQPKIIADPLLGYIHFTSLEVAIIDTKMFQRLRKISQLGLAHLVFPSLGYSRFEHSLGVVGRLNQLLNKIIENVNRDGDKADVAKIIDDNLVAIRLAALLHDVGHCLFSHCSERIIKKIEGENGYPNASYIQETFTKHFKKEKSIPFAEIFSLSILGSKRFLTFLEHLGLHSNKLSKKIAESTGRFILGLPLENKPETLFLGQLISSGLDVDKIDYMAREQHYSGIKLEIDLDRILSKLKVFNLQSFELPRNLEHYKKLYAANSTFKVLGFEKGGQFVFEEFCVARLALHVKIYLHQKVRAAESQLAKYLASLTSIPALKEVHNWLRLKESIVEVPEAINAALPTRGTLFEANISKSQIDNFKKIDSREIYYRAFSFGPMNSYSERYRDEKNEFHSERVEKYFDEFKLTDLKEKIIEHCVQICDEYKLDVDLYNAFDEIVLEYPRFLNIQQGQESLYFERASWLPLKWTIPIDKILIYFQENRALAFVFSPKEISHIVAVAAEKVLFEVSGKVFSQESTLSKNTFVAYTTLKYNLTGQGFYTRFPQLKPVSDYLQKAEASEKIQALEGKLAGFKSLNNEYISINKITTFVNQFPVYLQEACLHFLNHLEVYSEGLLAEELDKVLGKIKNGNQKVGVTYLGSVSDSGGHLAYHLRDVLEKYEVDSNEFNDTLILESDKLVFFDDNINSGLQLSNIFAEMIDEKDKLPQNCRLNENHHRKIATNQAKEKFKNMPIYLAYTVGSENAKEKVLDTLSVIGFKKENINISINKLLEDNKKIFSGVDSNFNHSAKKELRDYLTQIGEKLLLTEGKSEEKVESCKMGYSNAEAMVIFPYNIPTMTITALWCRGEIDDVPWIPLAERRRRGKQGKFIGED